MTSTLTKIRQIFETNNIQNLSVYRKMLCLECDSRIYTHVTLGDTTIQSIICHTLGGCQQKIKVASDKRVEEFLIDITNEYMQKFNLHAYYDLKEIQVGDAVTIKDKKKKDELVCKLSTYNVFEVNGNELLCSYTVDPPEITGHCMTIKVNPKNFLLGMRQLSPCQQPSIKQHLFFY